MKSYKADGEKVESIDKCQGDKLSMVCAPQADLADLQIDTGKMTIKAKADAESAKASCTITKKSADGKTVESIKVHVEIEGKPEGSKCQLSTAGFPFVADPRAKVTSYERPIVMNGSEKVTDFVKDCKKDVITITNTPALDFVKFDDKTGAVTVTPTLQTKAGKYDILVKRTSIDGSVETKKLSFTVPEPPKPACPFILSTEPITMKVTEKKSVSFLKKDGASYDTSLCAEKFKIVSVTGPSKQASDFFKIDPKTGKIDATPTDLVSSVGTYKIAVEVTDKDGKKSMKYVVVNTTADCGTKKVAEPIVFPKAISTAQKLTVTVPNALENDKEGVTWSKVCGYAKTTLKNAPDGVTISSCDKTTTTSDVKKTTDASKDTTKTTE